MTLKGNGGFPCEVSEIVKKLVSDSTAANCLAIDSILRRAANASSTAWISPDKSEISGSLREDRIFCSPGEDRFAVIETVVKVFNSKSEAIKMRDKLENFSDDVYKFWDDEK